MNVRAKKTRKAANQPERETARQSGDFAALRRMLVASAQCFSVSFAVCDDRVLRDDLIRRLRQEFPSIAVVELGPDDTDTYSRVEHAASSVRPDGVFVLDIEAHVPFGESEQSVLRRLNASRERWEALACPVVFWLASYAATLLASKAPDFWRYRSHQFEFVPEHTAPTAVPREPFPGFEAVDALPFEEKRFRVAELEARLREAGDPPPAGLVPHVLDWLYELARLYQHANRFEDAEAALHRAVTMAETQFGDADSRMSAALNNLATLLHATNRLAEAEPLMRRVLDIDETSFGTEHTNVARDLNNLAQLLQATNRLAEAEPLMRRALDIDETSFGTEHPEVARDLNNLARLLQATNRLAEAEPMIRRALAIDEASFGSEHPNVARDLNNLARLLHATNRLAEAEPLMIRSVLIFRKFTRQTGHKHPHPQVAFGNLASLWDAMGRTEDEIQEGIKSLTQTKT